MLAAGDGADNGKEKVGRLRRRRTAEARRMMRRGEKERKRGK